MKRTKYELNLEHQFYKPEDYLKLYDATQVLNTCQRLRHKISVLNRRLQRVRTENKRLREHERELYKLMSDYMVH